MRTHVALLRGVNVGGTGKLPMAELRAALTAHGFDDVATYIQSGNVVLGSRETTATIAAAVETILTAIFGLSRPVVVLDRDEYAELIANNPFPQVTEPKQLHAIVRADPVSPDDRTAVRRAAGAAREKGSPDEAAVVGRVVYLHTPDGIGRSALGARLTSRSSAPDGGGTARNWATVLKLRDLLQS
ncbi:DUF1697 domain-containing protein [Pseudonocardia phyllosphaerae]|uniref:DUF1697 domain-containing protein n=1 Tax=Pseudonocardia phyllosphaerae TaxID=3390502 RepID=UPI00397A4D76